MTILHPRWLSRILTAGAMQRCRFGRPFLPKSSDRREIFELPKLNKGDTRPPHAPACLRLGPLIGRVVNGQDADSRRLDNRCHARPVRPQHSTCARGCQRHHTAPDAGAGFGASEGSEGGRLEVPKRVIIFTAPNAQRDPLTANHKIATKVATARQLRRLLTPLLLKNSAKQA